MAGRQVIGRKKFRVVTLRAATPLIRWLYSLTLLSILFSVSLLGVSGAVGMVYGIGMSPGRTIILLLIVVASLYRIVRVARFPPALDVNITGLGVRMLRGGGVFLMCVGITAALLMIFRKPFTLLIFPNPGDNGIGFFVVGVFLYAFSAAGWLGVIAFEFARFLGNRHDKTTDNR
ncbi:MAG TPA: hypothetical protein VHW71_04295 [Steroidobacteraceae bacterium]|nr:hypothetical protein [Steroidobacteraceae bacterium]